MTVPTARTPMRSALVTDRQGRTLRADEMAALLRSAREAAPAPFETTIMMDRDALNSLGGSGGARTDLSRPDRTLRPEEFPAAPGEENSPGPVVVAGHQPARGKDARRVQPPVCLPGAADRGRRRRHPDQRRDSWVPTGPMCSESPAPCWGRGRRPIALHLAMTIARDTFKRVCLIDMSLGKGDLAARLGVPARGEGVVPVLEDSNNVVPTLQLAGCDNLVIIPAGKVPTNAARLARSPRVAQLVISARLAFDVVIVDMPAVASDNALPLTRHVDGLLVVTRAGATPRDVVVQALDALGRDKVIGVALNRVKAAGPSWLRKRAARA